MKSEENIKDYFETNKDDVDFSGMKYLHVEESANKIIFHKQTEFNFKIFTQSVFLTLALIGISYLIYRIYTSDGAFRDDMLVPYLVLSLFIFLLFIWIINIIFNGYTLTVTEKGMHIKKLPFNRKMKFKKNSSTTVSKSRKSKGNKIVYDFGYTNNVVDNDKMKVSLGGNMWLSRETKNDYLIMIFIAKTIKKKFGIPHSIDKYFSM